MNRRRFIQGLLASFAAAKTASAVDVLYAPPEAEVVAKVLGEVTWTLYQDAHILYIHGRLIGTEVCARRTVGAAELNMVFAAMERIEDILRAKAVEKGLGTVREEKIAKPALEAEINKQLRGPGVY